MSRLTVLDTLRRELALAEGEIGYRRRALDARAGAWLDTGTRNALRGEIARRERMVEALEFRIRLRTERLAGGGEPRPESGRRLVPLGVVVVRREEGER